MRVQFYLGLGGVSGIERASARHIGRLFDFLMAVVAIFLFTQWHLEMSGMLSDGSSVAIDWVVFVFFLVKFVLLSCLVQHKERYWAYNWFNPIVALLMLPLLFRPDFAANVYQIIRPILALCMFVPWLGLLRLSLMDGKLLTTLVSLVFVVIISGVVMTGIDPGIRNVGDGIWWAWVTMSTVGFGDYVPVSVLGRIVASVIILMGLCFFAILTANFSRIFIRREMFEVSREESIELKKVRDLEKRLKTIESHLVGISDQLEKSQDKKNHSE